MRQFALHPVEFRDGKVLEQDAIGVLLLEDEVYELRWNDGDRAPAFEENLQELLDSPIYGIAPRPNPMFKATVRTALEFSSDAWLAKVAEVLEGPEFRLRLRELAPKRTV